MRRRYLDYEYLFALPPLTLLHRIMAQNELEPERVLWWWRELMRGWQKVKRKTLREHNETVTLVNEAERLYCQIDHYHQTPPDGWEITDRSPFDLQINEGYVSVLRWQRPEFRQ